MSNATRRVIVALSALVGVLVGTILAVVTLPVDQEAGAARGGYGCRAAKHCKPPKVRPTPTSSPTPVAPGCVTYGPECVIDTTTGWPTVGPVVVVQTFPCPLSPVVEPEEEAEPCETATTTTTASP